MSQTWSHHVPSLDRAETGRLPDAFARLVPALQAFSEREGPDRTAALRAVWQPRLDRPLSEQGAGIDGVLDDLLVAVEHGCRMGAPGFSGFISTSGTTAALAASTASAVAGGQRYLLHAFNALERVGLRWLAEVCGLPSSWEGVFTSGGSTAQIVALAAARQWAYEQHGVDVGTDGLPPGLPGRIYISEHGHRTVHRAAAVLGFGRAAVRDLPLDGRQRLSLPDLERALEEDRRAGLLPVAVVAVAGTTSTGAVDPLADVLELGRRYGAWVHVDGAYGLVAAVDPEVRPLLDAVGHADSAIVDPHKWLATGVGVGAAYVRDAGVLQRALHEGEASYLEPSFSGTEGAQSQFDALGGPWADESLELSAPPRGVLVWSVLREIGLAGLRERVARHRALARHVTERAREHARLEPLTDPQLSIACFRYLPEEPLGDLDALTSVILQRLRRETPYVPSAAVVGGRLALRPCFVNPRTRLADVDGLVDAVIRIGDEESAART